jgi:flavodoxin
MKAIVVCESHFGNTHGVAESIAGGLGAELLSVDEPPPQLGDVDLLVVGAPTHVHGLTSERSRIAAAEQGGAGGRGVREWLEELPPGHARAAAFDTRFDKPTFLTGSAAKGIAKRLRGKGYELAVEPESFFVDGTEGPVHEGELERAAEWAASLGKQVEDVERLPVGSH